MCSDLFMIRKVSLFFIRVYFLYYELLVMSCYVRHHHSLIFFRHTL